MYIDFSGEDYVYSVCLLKRNINVNLNCKKSCEYPSISCHLLKVFGNEYRYMINILYIKKQLLWASDSYQTRKCSFLFFLFYSWLIFLCFFCCLFVQCYLYVLFLLKESSWLLSILAGIAIKEHIQRKCFRYLSQRSTQAIPQYNPISDYLRSWHTTHVDMSVACAFIITMIRSVWFFLYSG